MESGLLCLHPASYRDFFTEGLDMESYQCQAEDLPFTYPEWEEYWYSPVCRPWYKDQKMMPAHAVMTEIYQFPSGKD